MSGKNCNVQKLEPINRPVGNTEHSWCRAISYGTGMAVLTLQVSKPLGVPLLQEGLRKLQDAHPILRSKLHYNTSKKAFSFITPETPHIQVKSFNLSSTSHLLKNLSEKSNGYFLSPLHIIQEHELNNNAWATPYNFPSNGVDVFLASVYELPGSKWIMAFRFHTAVCDRTTAVTLLRELMEFAGEKIEGDEKGAEPPQGEINYKEKMKLGIEDLIPSGKAKKTLWARGLDVLEYSVNSLRLTNLKFKDVKWPRFSEVARLQMNPHETNQILAVSNIFQCNIPSKTIHHFFQPFLHAFTLDAACSYTLVYFA